MVLQNANTISTSEISFKFCLNVTCNFCAVHLIRNQALLVDIYVDNCVYNHANVRVEFMILKIYVNAACVYNYVKVINNCISAIR